MLRSAKLSMQNQNGNNIYPQLLSIGESSEYLGVSIDTLRRWEKKGRIQPLRSPGGHRYFNKESLDNLFGKRYTREVSQTNAPSGQDFSENQNSNQIPQISKETKIGLQFNNHLTSQMKSSENGKDSNSLTDFIPSSICYQDDIPCIPVSIKEKYESFILRDQNISSIQEKEIHTIRKIQIPATTPLKIIEEETLVEKLTIDSMENVNRNILLPPIPQTYGGNINNNESMPKANLTNTAEIEVDKKILIYSSFIVGSIFLLFSWYLLWKNSQIVLSPVP